MLWLGGGNASMLRLEGQQRDKKPPPFAKSDAWCASGRWRRYRDPAPRLPPPPCSLSSATLLAATPYI